ncbi:hypothetical protein P22_1945 [Propionispora sp. 2/2-37]|uniref:hypothetical protein n=1 Tax=Propionispora sp. 2/2-37 TaxID=1677858 RepID=UPI0006BB98CB|nr:hypothetical protein [Propionispora sp. 2/2-37]CUH95859.1 hypothetical protein P22_1945 [Propionispora sp. 2/2-37]
MATIRHFNSEGIVSEEHYFDKDSAGNLVKVASWYFDGEILTVIQYRNRDNIGNYYKTEHKYTDCEYWVKNKRKELF